MASATTSKPAVMDRRITNPRSHMALWATLAVVWVVLGANSGNVPFSGTMFWLTATSLTAGAALGVAHRGTRNSMLVYLVAALLVGGFRSVAYLLDGAGGPSAVWLIVTLTNVVLLDRWDRRYGG